MDERCTSLGKHFHFPKSLSYRYILFNFASPYCALQIFFFSQIEGLWKPCIEQAYWHHFPTAVPHFMSPCLILVILTIFHTFSLLLYLLRWPVLRDLWCYYCNCFGVPHTTPIEDGKLDKNVMYVLTAPQSKWQYFGSQKAPQYYHI